jgi:hypothetical protein
MKNRFGMERSSCHQAPAHKPRFRAQFFAVLIPVLVAACVNQVPPVFAQTAVFGTPGIELKPFTMNHRQSSNSVINLSFLLDAPAGKAGFIRVQGNHLIKPDGKPIRFWGVNLTEWSRGSVEIPSKEDAPLWADTLARFGVNYVRLHFLDLAAPCGMIDAIRDDTQHFDLAQLDKEDFFIAELLKRGIYVDLNLNVGRGAKAGDNVLVVQNRIAKGPLLFDKRLIELEKDYACQLLTHINPYTKKAYVDEPGVAIVEIVNEDAIYIGWSSRDAYDQELTDLYNAWLQKNLNSEKLAKLREMAGVANNQPVPRLKGAALRNAPKERYYTEYNFFTELESGFFNEMNSYLKDTLKVKCPVIATADHSHSGSGYSLVADTSQLDVVDGHTYWQHPSERNFKNAPMVNDPFNSTVVELSRTAVVDKPYTVPVASGFGAVAGRNTGEDVTNRQMSSYDLYYPPWAASPDKVFDAQEQFSFVGGEFVWTGWDYLGEPTPFNSSRSSYFGIIDLAGFKKDRFYLYQAHWRPDLKMAHILPHWTWPERVGQVTPVHVYTSGDEGELFLNGKSLGRKKKDTNDFRLRWDDVVYQPGELKVVTYKNGKKWATDVVKTTGPAARLTLQPDRNQIHADGKDLSFVTVSVTDKDGLTVPRSKNRIHFEIEGPGEIVATNNGDSTSMESFQSPDRNAFNGLALVIVRTKEGQPGTIKLTAQSDGLKEAAVRIKSQSAD